MLVYILGLDVICIVLFLYFFYECMFGLVLYFVYYDIFKVDVFYVYGKDRDFENNLRFFKDGKFKF